MLAISKSPVALPLTGATAQCDLVARRRRNAPRPGKPLKKLQIDNSIYGPCRCELVALLSAAQAGDDKQRHQCPIKLTCAATIRQPQANRTQVCC
ncbi:hypothetical protein F6O44_04020 [Klebsiella aerogenes]|nr:hypothetical protein F6O44_04020 [Klebsiella aerogenes]